MSGRVRQTLRLKEHIDRFIHAPQTEIALVVLILLSVFLVVVEVVLDTRGLSTQWVSHLQAGLTGIFMMELSCRYWIARKKKAVLA